MPSILMVISNYLRYHYTQSLNCLFINFFNLRHFHFSYHSNTPIFFKKKHFSLGGKCKSIASCFSNFLFFRTHLWHNAWNPFCLVGSYSICVLNQCFTHFSFQPCTALLIKLWTFGDRHSPRNKFEKITSILWLRLVV